MPKRRRRRRNGEGSIVYRTDRKQWYCRYFDADGNRHQKSASSLAKELEITLSNPELLTSKTEGQKTALGILAAVTRREEDKGGGPSNEAGVDEIIKAYLEYQAVRNSESHVKRVKQCLDRIVERLGSVKVSDITVAKVQGYQGDRLNDNVQNLRTKSGYVEGRTISRRTINMEVAALKSMLNWARATELIVTNPIPEVSPLATPIAEKRIVRRALTVEEIERLFRDGPERWRLVWRVFLGTGMRRGEVCSLKWSDIDFQNGLVRIRPENAKNGEGRIVPLHPTILEEIREYHAEATRKASLLGTELPDIVFTTSQGGNIYPNLLRAFYRSLKAAKINPEGVDLHACRASWITHEIDSGRNPRHVQAIAGHKTFALTMDTYYKVSPSALLTSVSRLPYLDTARDQLGAPEGGAQ